MSQHQHTYEPMCVYCIRELTAQRDELLAACRAAIGAINGLSDQQAMTDDFWKPAYATIEAAIARCEKEPQ